ncbi:MAG: Transcriptional regulator, AraC [Paenibacillus sp.]|nr:Transcriptional regulator, AraC [Paenibacillus sp.]
MSDFHHNIRLFFDGFGLHGPSGHGSESKQLRSSIGEGTIRRFGPRPDLEVVCSELTCHGDFVMPVATSSPMVELLYCLQGTRVLHIERKPYEITPGMCALQLIGEVEAQFEFAGNQPYRVLGIGIPVSTFHRYLEDFSGGGRLDFANLLGRQSYRLFQESIDPAASVIAGRLTHSVQKSGVTNLETECRVLELLLSAFQSFFDEPKRTSLSTDEIHKIKRVREIVLECMANPPSLVELSRMVGLNDNKLKIGFKELYGTTVFGYLREKRLETALRLLQQGDLNVNETSLAVGYSNPSYFSEAFREKFGVNPGSLNRRS